ncbi:MAG: hypothetical protein ABIB47_06370 [Candidatus Woesearchaeota archaeon]
MRIKLIDIIFWALILSAVGVAIWLLVGSPTIEQGLLMITISIAASEILIWKALFRVDKKTAIGFEKVRSQLSNIQRDIKEVKTIVKK